ncbi:unnamed protein product [Cochlearia groenlandica]
MKFQVLNANSEKDFLYNDITFSVYYVKHHNMASYHVPRVCSKEDKSPGPSTSPFVSSREIWCSCDGVEVGLLSEAGCQGGDDRSREDL